MQLGNRHFGTIWNNADAGTHLFSRGSTGHSLSRISNGKHLDKFGIINMNGRLYDPLLGRFLSPEPIVQYPGNTQSYNRYSYCLNNLLIFTDPSGYNYYGYQQQQDADNARIDGINRQLQWDSYNSFKALDQFRDLFYFSESGGEGSYEHGGGGGNYWSPMSTLSIFSADGSSYQQTSYTNGISSSYMTNSAGMSNIENHFSSSFGSLENYRSPFEIAGDKMRLAWSHYSNAGGMMFGGPGKKGAVISIANLTAAYGVGGTFDIGAVVDGDGDAKMYLTFGFTIGLGASASMGYNTTNKSFRTNQLAGEGISASLSVKVPYIGKALSVEGFGDYKNGEWPGRNVLGGGLSVGLGAGYFKNHTYTIIAPLPPKDFWCRPGRHF